MRELFCAGLESDFRGMGWCGTVGGLREIKHVSYGNDGGWVKELESMYCLEWAVGRGRWSWDAARR